MLRYTYTVCYSFFFVTVNMLLRRKISGRMSLCEHRLWPGCLMRILCVHSAPVIRFNTHTQTHTHTHTLVMAWNNQILRHWTQNRNSAQKSAVSASLVLKLTFSYARHVRWSCPCQRKTSTTAGMHEGRWFMGLSLYSIRKHST